MFEAVDSDVASLGNFTSFRMTDRFACILNGIFCVRPGVTGKKKGGRFAAALLQAEV
jgi:hypothetical protein